MWLSAILGLLSTCHSDESSGCRSLRENSSQFRSRECPFSSRDPKPSKTYTYTYAVRQHSITRASQTDIGVPLPDCTERCLQISEPIRSRGRVTSREWRWSSVTPGDIRCREVSPTNFSGFYTGCWKRIFLRQIFIAALEARRYRFDAVTKFVDRDLQ